MANNDRAKLARIELAKRELARRQSSQTQPEQGVLGAVGAAMGSRPELQPYAYQPGMDNAPAPQGYSGVVQSALGAAGQTLAAPIRTGATISAGTDALGAVTSEGLGYASAKITPNTSPLAKKIADYGAATAGMAVSAIPMLLSGGGGTKYSTELAPYSGKPGVAARIKQTRTGVDAADFERLRRDPMAFFSTESREDLGKAIGSEKVKAGINVGVTGDVKSLTKENLLRARNISTNANKAQNEIVSKIDELASKFPDRALTPQEIVIGADIKPNQVNTALEGVNQRLSRIARSEGQGSPAFQQWSAIKTHFQDMLEQSAPAVKQANKAFSRVALRDKFREPFPVNQSGTMSKISAFGGAPLVGGVGAMIGGGPGAVLGAGLYQAARSPFVAGLGTAARGLADKALDPALTSFIRGMSKKQLIAAYIAERMKGTEK